MLLSIVRFPDVTFIFKCHLTSWTLPLLFQIAKFICKWESHSGLNRSPWHLNKWISARSLPGVLCYICLCSLTHMPSVSRYVEIFLGRFIQVKVRPPPTNASPVSSCFSLFPFHRESVSPSSSLRLIPPAFIIHLLQTQLQHSLCFNRFISDIHVNIT